MSDIRVRDVAFDYAEYKYRSPIKFGGVALDRVTLLDVTITVESLDGGVAVGRGSMPLGNVWAYPSRVMGYDATLGAMKALTDRVARLTADCTIIAHPMDITHALEPAYLHAAAALGRELALPEPIPGLATLVVGSPFDAALHDAYGKLHGVSAYHTLGKDYLAGDLGHFLGRDFAGLRIDAFVSREPVATMPLYHLVGALDPLEPADVSTPVADGLPETLGDWIVRDGLTHLKIKLNGDDIAWDADRVTRVDRVAEAAGPGRAWKYSLDFNERCSGVDVLLEFLDTLRERSPRAFDRVAYIEQPTARDLKANRRNTMHEAAKVRPVVIDESLTDLESLLLAREMGYTGVALKACKGQTQSLLMAAAARHFGMFLCVQDLTCPGASFIHSAGLAAHVPGVTAIEGNGRQYCPAANAEWEERFPGVFLPRGGVVATGTLTGPGLGAYPPG